jgi:hypothetical protein
MVTGQSGHRRDLERHVVVSDSRRSNWGLAAAFTLFVLCIGACAWLGTKGHNIPAVAVIAAPVLGAVTSFIYGTNSRRQERNRKAKIMTGQLQDDEDEDAPEDEN